MRSLVEQHGVTAVVETGTSTGETSAFLARLDPSLPVYSCEIQPDTFKRAATRLARFPNVKAFQSSSPAFLKSLLATGACGELPLFWLDAHWFAYWPLRDELSIITNNLEKAILMIDDFQVPGKPQFGFDTTADYQPGPTESEPAVCGLDYIRPVLKHVNYAMWLSAYRRKDAFPWWDSRPLLGCCFIVVNAPALANALQDNSLVKRFFEPHLGPALSCGPKE